ncbi:MAG: hypothetical protein IT432_12255 [Phycisphaerales bacterium]|nr:hypothetical protein [Phycisphaerales bacterium]
MAYLINFDLIAIPVSDASWNAFIAGGGTSLRAFDHMQNDLTGRQADIGGPWKDIYSSEASPMKNGGLDALNQCKGRIEVAASNVLVSQAVTLFVPDDVSWIPVGDRHLIHIGMIAGGQAVVLPCRTQAIGQTLSYEVAARALIRDLERP